MGYENMVSLNDDGERGVSGARAGAGSQCGPGACLK